MGNYKDMTRAVASLLERDKPFLIIKYCVTMCERANNVYEIVTLGGRKLQYLSLDRSEAIEVINKFKLPLLYEMDSRNMIWSDDRFLECYQKMKGVISDEA